MMDSERVIDSRDRFAREETGLGEGRREGSGVEWSREAVGRRGGGKEETATGMPF